MIKDFNHDKWSGAFSNCMLIIDVYLSVSLLGEQVITYWLALNQQLFVFYIIYAPSLLSAFI